MLGKWLRERRRRAAARQLGVGPDAPPTPSLQRLADRAALAFDAEMAAVSIIEGNHQWFKASHGVDDGGEPSERSQSFCTHTIEGDGLFEVIDPLGDLRFATSTWVTRESGLRYYIGAPLRLRDGLTVGALCVLDTKTHSPASADQRAYLLALARQASSEIEILSYSRRHAVA
ncbi:GAF domain-containing protein [Stakelama sp. CBK3Z-3]|uniref:GAF domain-containing protein n=1 Tax=Stakelama flava TaxID=2860338 RepID=A0ABS6XR78_9SPHN|nr:GAF domain-containing protein [Stakelama flava]MBW4331906.1 GAF domain-containing protein [Stakelama flava]